MAFRDETEALRHQKKVLGGEVTDLEKKKASIEASLLTLEEDLEREVELRVGNGVSAVGLAALAVPLIALGVMNCSGGGSDSEMLFGEVSAITGDAPLTTGTPCTFFVHYVSDDDSSYDAQVEVICGGQTLYGGDGSGYLDCEWDDDIATSCTDDDFSYDGGDPKLRFDRGAWRLLVAEGRPAWRVQIQLDRVAGH